MAGGMGTSGHGPMSERVARSQPQRPAGTENLKHCWVTDRHGRLPGLLLEWRQVAAGWQGRVVHPVPDGTGWALIEEWVAAELLEPAGGARRPD